MQRAQAALNELDERAGWLDASLAPGTPRPYRQPNLTREARAEADARARIERLERIDTAPGDSPDPVWSDGIELRTDILALADAMASRVAQLAGVDPMPDASWDADARRYLRFVARWLLMASEVDGQLPGNVQRKCEQLTARADVLLGHVTDGQTLSACCPFCGGRTDGAPNGGERTMRVRTLPGSRLTPARTVVVCEGGLCAPTTADCGIWWRGMPAWDLEAEGAWLADRIERVSAA